MRTKSAPAPALADRDLPALPAGWTWATIEQLAAPERNAITDGPFGSNLKTCHYTDDGPRVIRLQNIGDGVFVDERACISQEHFERLAKHHVQAGDVVVAALGERPPRSCVVPEWLGPAMVKADCIRFKPAPYACLAAYANYALNAEGTRERVSAIVHGVGRPRLNLGEVKAIAIPLAPVPEQRRIVAEIEKQFSRLDAGVVALERVRAGLKRYRAAVLQAACTGRLVPTEAELARAEGRDYEPAGRLLGRILAERRSRWEGEQRAKMAAEGKLPLDGAWKAKYQEPAPPDTTDLPDLPEGWMWTNLGQCFPVHVGATPSRAQPGYWNGDTPWVSSGEVQFCRIRETRECITEEGLRNSSTQVNPPGSVLLGMIGEGRTRGQVALIEIAACNNQNCAAIWVSQTEVPPVFVYYWLWSQYEVTRRGSSGNNQPALNKTRVEQLVIPLPPLAEQQRIVAEVERRISVVDELEALVAANLKRAERLRQAILKRAFEGRLVPQDPNDEPARVLLARMRQAREVASKDGRAPLVNRDSHQGVPEVGA